MAAKRDYYEVLGVPRAASQDELKKAFRRLARQYHPDVSREPNAEARFKEINEAYSVLSDEQKRARYDRYGHRGVGDVSSGFSGFPDIEEIFADFFGGFRTSRGPRRRPGRDLAYDLKIDFEEAVFGVEKEIELSRLESCPVCRGSGAEPGTSPRRCPECGGAGEVQQARQTLLGSMLYNRQCPRCNGRGEVVDTPCRHCNGKGRARVLHRLTVNIPAGIDDGMQVRLAGQGDAGDPGTPTGDLYVRVRVRKHKFFQRHKDDIVLDLSINVVQATLGDKIKVPTVDGEGELVIPAGTQPGTVFTMRGKGIPRLRRDGSTSGRGDQVVRLQVEIPRKLTDEQRKLFEQLDGTVDRQVIPQPPAGKGIFERFVDWISGE